MGFKTKPKLIQVVQRTFALRENGTVWSWGYENGTGYLGRPEFMTSGYHTPGQVSGPDGIGHLEEIVDMVAGRYSATALRSDGTVWVWGQNNNGQLGNPNTLTESPVPIQVRGINNIGYLTNIKSIWGGNSHEHYFALSHDGTLYFWGKSAMVEAQYSPIVINKGVTNIVSVANCNGNSTMYLCNDGALYSWGYTGYTGTGEERLMYVSEAKRVMTEQGTYLNKISDISYTFALNDSGQLWGWGNTPRLGVGVPEDGDVYRMSAVRVRNEDGTGYLENIKYMSETPYMGIMVAIDTDNKAFVWGVNSEGCAGFEDYNKELFYPTRAPWFDNALLISSYNTYVCFAGQDGYVWTLGNRAFDLSNNGESGNTHIPQPVLYEPGGKQFNLFDKVEEPDPGPKPEPDNCCKCCCGPSIQFNVPMKKKNKDVIRGMYDLFETLEGDCC